MIYALSDFVAISSVSNSEPHQEDCRQAAKWLTRSLTKLGAEAALVSPFSCIRAFTILPAHLVYAHTASLSGERKEPSRLGDVSWLGR